MVSSLAAFTALIVLMACSDGQVSTAEPPGPGQLRPGALRSTVASFACDVVFDATTYTNPSELAPYDVEPVTETSRVCETWTGSDYNVEVTQIASSEPESDYSEDIKTVVYQNGSTSAYDANGSHVETQPDVGATGFEFVAATPEEQEASYNDPYYGILASPDPGCERGCILPTVLVGQNERPASSATDPNPIKRKALRSLLKGKTEITPSLEGYRQFRHTNSTGEEITISVDPVTELIRRQETKNTKGIVRADLSWKMVREKYVRERMDIVSDEKTGNRRHVSRTTVTLGNVQWNPLVVK